MTTKFKALVVTALVGLMVLAFGAMAFAQSTSVSGTGTFDLPGSGSSSRLTGTGAGGLDAAGIGKLGDSTDERIVSDLLDLPALNAGCTASGRVVMDLPALKLNSAPNQAACAPVRAAAAPHAPHKLPKTGANVGDIFALGMAALAGGGIVVRRLKLSLAS